MRSVGYCSIRVGAGHTHSCRGEKERSMKKLQCSGYIQTHRTAQDRVMIELGSLEKGSSPIEEMMELTAQSLSQLEIKEHFNIIKEIGRGKYGRVLLVTHRFRGTPMALKVLPKASTQLKGFLREYCISLHLSCHPCIVSLFGIAFQSNDHYGFAQELVVGRDLFAIIKPRVGIPECVVKRCAVQISSALEFIHNMGLVHRDIKPENVLLLDTQCRSIKLADFGLTQKCGTLIRYISATLPYMAPELCAMVPEEGEEDPNVPPLSVQPCLDTYAFGVLLFCILTGFFPWDHCTDSDDFYLEFAKWRQDMDKTEVPSQWRRFTPACMEMFSRLLALEPNDRGPVDVVKRYVSKDWVRPKEQNGLVNKSGGVGAMEELSPCQSSSVLQ